MYHFFHTVGCFWVPPTWGSPKVLGVPVTCSFPTAKQYSITCWAHKLLCINLVDICLVFSQFLLVKLRLLWTFIYSLCKDITFHYFLGKKKTLRVKIIVVYGEHMLNCMRICQTVESALKNKFIFQIKNFNIEHFSLHTPVCFLCPTRCSSSSPCNPGSRAIP